MAHRLIFLVALLLAGTLYGWSRPARVQIAIDHLFSGIARGISWLAAMTPILVIGPVAFISILTMYVLIPLFAWTAMFVLVRFILAALNLLPELDGLAIWHALPEWVWHASGAVVTGGLTYFAWNRPVKQRSHTE